jgi:endoglucanase
VSEGRNGYWYTFNDGSEAGIQQPVSNGRITSAQAVNDNGSQFAAWTQGGGFRSWGGGLGLTFRLSNRPYNASKYRGISFWAKIAPGSTNSVRVNVSDDQTAADGGICTECWDHFGLAIVLSERWGRYSFEWKDLAQRGWGAPLVAAINPAKLRGIEFAIQEGVDFELYVDNVAFW